MSLRKDRRAWTEEEDQALRAALANGTPHIQIAAQLGRSVSSIGVHASRIGASGGGASKPIWEDDEARDASVLSWPDFRDQHPERTMGAYHNARRRFRDRFVVPQVELVDYRRLVQRVEGDAVVVSCVHCPQTDPEMWARVLAVCERDKPDHLIIAGDIVTGDMWSRFTVRESYLFEHELESVRLHLRAALEVVPSVVITPGNHISHRIVVKTDGHIRLQHVIRLAGLSDAEEARIRTTDIDYVSLVSGGEHFKIGHAQNYSIIDGNIPREYATVEECHVITGHGHRMAFQMTRSGRWGAYEIGTVANPAYMGYANRGLSKLPKMVQGFCAVRNGAVRLYGRGLPLTDWTAELAS